VEYSQDGAPMTNRNFGGEANTAQAILPDPDSVQKAKFETLNSSAQFSTPATVILTTKSGTNEYRGSFFETARNNAIGVARAKQNPANFTSPHQVRNEFGASIGGPISIAKLYDGKNKTFFLALNALNLQGRVHPNTTDGTESLQTSYWTPKQIQFSGGLTF
jgi:hypothetical protein